MGATGKKWRIGAFCALFIGSSVAVPIVVETVASATASPTQIVYVQKSGQQTTGPFVEYEGTNGNTSTQSLSPLLTSSTCSSSTSTVNNPSSAALLPITASYYPSGYGSQAKTATVGTSLVGGSRGVAETGVCYSSSVSPGYTLQPNEGIVFSMGETNLLTEGQLFSEASIPVKNNRSTSASVDLVLRKANSSGEQSVETVGPITVPAAGTESEGDTNDCPLVSTGVVSSSDEFDQVELRVISPSSASLSVIGPNCDSDNDKDDQGLPTFTLANAAPVFTSPNSDVVAASANGSFNFTVSATGTPTPTFSVSGAPSGVSITNTSSPTGTATLTGSSVAPGKYSFTVDAANSAGTTPLPFTLTVMTTITQVAPLDNSTTTAASSGFKDQLATSGGVGGVTYSTTSVSAPQGAANTIQVDSNGKVTTTGDLEVGTYTARGTTSDSIQDSGSWTYTLTVNAVSGGIIQDGDETGNRSTVTGPPFSDQLSAETGTYAGKVTWVLSQVVPPTNGTPNAIQVSPSGAITTATNLYVGTYTANGTMSDGLGDSGYWSYTLTVNPVAITQAAPTDVTINTTMEPWSDQLNATAGTYLGPFTYLQNAGSDVTSSESGYDLNVSQSGAVTTNGTLPGGQFTSGGTVSDSYGDMGSWIYDLTVNEAPAITSLNNYIVPAPASGSGTAFSFTVVATGYPVPSVGNVTTIAGCTPSTPSDNFFSFTPGPAGSGTGTIAGTPNSGDGGTYTLCLDASNGVEPDATQVFSLIVTSPTQPLMASPENGTGDSTDPLSASISLDSGTKSFQDFTAAQASLGGTTTVSFDTEGPTDEYFTATVDVSFGLLTYCVPFPSTVPPTCAPTEVSIGEGPMPSSEAVYPCGPNDMPSNSDPPSSQGWCSESDSYSYSVVNGTEYTTISQVLYGAGDVTFSHG